MKSKKAFPILGEAVKEFFRDDCPTLGAGLAFFTALSLAPLIVVIVSFAGYFGIDVRQVLINQVSTLISSDTKGAVTSIIGNAKSLKVAASISTVFSILVLLYSATLVFSYLHKSMNRIWGVKSESGPLFRWIKKHVMSLAMIIIIVLLLFTVIIANATASFIFSGFGINWQLVHSLISLAVFTLLFAMIFKLLPDVKIEWKDTWVGAFISSILFYFVTMGIGKYLRFLGITSAHGALSSFMVLLIWVYASSLILFYGTEVMQVYYRRHNKKNLPPKYNDTRRNDRTNDPLIIGN